MQIAVASSVQSFRAKLKYFLQLQAKQPVEVRRRTDTRFLPDLAVERDRQQEVRHVAPRQDSRLERHRPDLDPQKQKYKHGTPQ